VGWWRLAERFAFAAGISLLLVYGLIRYLGASGSRRELRPFREARAASSGQAPAAAGEAGRVLSIPLASLPDQSLWSPERIQGWRESLGRAAPAPLAVLRIPRIGLEAPVLEGTDDETLNRGVGRIDGTALPGAPGNLGIAGHRDGFFRGLKDIAPGDALELETLRGQVTYVVQKIWIVSPEEVSVLDPTPAPSVTLVTCYPFSSWAPRRSATSCAP
jgi:sortase A